MNGFGYTNNGPCIALKLNRVFGWTPKAFSNPSELPGAILDAQIANALDPAVYKNHVFVKCEGEYSADKDALTRADVVYFSENGSRYNITEVGLIPFYYFPYLNQPGFESPLVFVQFKKLDKFLLVNVLCKAYAANIDSDDKYNKRGMTQFQLYIEK